MKPTVLHVSEAFGGGIVSAIAQFARLTRQQYRHVLLARSRKNYATGDSLCDDFDQIILSRDSLLKFGVGLKRWQTANTPEIVHLHSTWAGLIGRILLARRNSILYSPHCFGFERKDVGAANRALVRLAEVLLSPLQFGYAAIGGHEAGLAGQLSFRGRVWTIPNSVDPDQMPRLARRQALPGQPVCVAMVGRTVPQKGLDFFVEVARQLEPAQFRLIWIGGGSTAGELRLRHAGIEVTGWLDRRCVLRQLAREADVYLHTAEWEGTPMTLLEAATLGLPIVCRRIPHLADVPVRDWADTPTQAADLLRRMAFAGDPLDGSVCRAAILAHFAPERTRAALLDAYDSCRSARPAKGDARPAPALSAPQGQCS